MRDARRRNTEHPLVQVLALLAAAAVLILSLRLLTTYIPLASDWEVYFQPTIRGWLEGDLVLYKDRIGTGGVWNFPWLGWPLIPLAVWPAWLGWGLLVVVTLIVMAWLTRDYRRRWLVFASPLIGDLVINGQVDVIPMLGIGLGWLATDRPHLLGLALVLMSAKPQACFLVALWMLLHHKHRMRALLVPVAVFILSLVIHGWDWPLRWASGPPVFGLMANVNNSTPWASIGLWMAPVALALGVWALRLPHTRLKLGALVAANALIAPYLSSHSLVQVLTFSLLPLGRAWALAGWVASCTVLLRGWLGKSAMHLDFAVAAVLMIGYLLHAKPSRQDGGSEEARR